jgi:hypothetical protein
MLAKYDGVGFPSAGWLRPADQGRHRRMSVATSRFISGAMAGIVAVVGLDSICQGLILAGAAQLLMSLGIVLFALSPFSHDD